LLKAFDNDTIAAIATPCGSGGIGVLRVSGKEALRIADRIFESKKKISVLEQKGFTVQYGHVISKENAHAQIVDEVLLLVMRAPKSYTCEDMVEISAHGGPAVMQAILQLLLKAGARLAEKGEFTKRAFLNGRLDLLQAEAVLDLVKAKTELGRRWAVSQLEGVLSKRLGGVKEELLEVLVNLEASIDFPGDFLETGSMAEMEKKLAAAAETLKALWQSSGLGIVVKNGLRVVIAGRPNVGKSSLMNRLSRSNRVIVTPYAGTTRDVVEEEIQLRGFLIRLLDTAGLQETSHPIEQEGIERSKLAVSQAGLVLYVLDGSQAFHPEDSELLSGLAERSLILVVNKTDLPRKLNRGLLKGLVDSWPVVHSSCTEEGGIKELEDEIFRFVSGGKTDFSNDSVVTSVRQKDILEKAMGDLDKAKDACRARLSPELVAVDLRLALDHLGALVGDVYTADLLELLFNQFCIGK